MAQITKRKSGYLIHVSCGYSADGKQKTQSMTWKPPRESMTEKQIEKAVSKAACEFEKQCAAGQVVNVSKLQNFIEDWFVTHENALKPAMLKKYRDCCPRIFSKIGHIRLDRLKTKDIDNFLSWLSNERNAPPLAKCKIDLKQILTDNNETQTAFSKRAGVDAHIVRSCYGDNCIKWENAVKIAEALNKTPTSVFCKVENENRLSPKTIRCYHGFLSTVFIAIQ